MNGPEVVDEHIPISPKQRTDWRVAQGTALPAHFDGPCLDRRRSLSECGQALSQRLGCAKLVATCKELRWAQLVSDVMQWNKHVKSVGRQLRRVSEQVRAVAVPGLIPASTEAADQSHVGQLSIRAQYCLDDGQPGAV